MSRIDTIRASIAQEESSIQGLHNSLRVESDSLSTTTVALGTCGTNSDCMQRNIQSIVLYQNKIAEINKLISERTARVATLKTELANEIEINKNRETQAIANEAERVQNESRIKESLANLGLTQEAVMEREKIAAQSQAHALVTKATEEAESNKLKTYVIVGVVLVVVAVAGFFAFKKIKNK